MFGRRALLLALLLITSSLSALPAAAAGGVPVKAQFALPAGTQDILVAPAGDGSLLAAAVTGTDTQFFRVPATATDPVRWLAAYDFVASAAPSPLSAPRLAASSSGDAAIAFEAGGTVRAAAVNTLTGSQAFEVLVSQPGEAALHPTVAFQGDAVVVAYYAVSSAGARVCVVALDATGGSEQSRSCAATGGAPLPALVADGQTLHLLTFGPSLTRLASVAGGAVTPTGSAALGGQAAALTVKAGQLLGIVADGASTYRISAPLQDLSALARAVLPVPSWTTSVKAAFSNDGRVAAVGTATAGAYLVAEAGLSQYSVEARAAPVAAAAATDSFGLAHVLLAEGTPLDPLATSFAVGDPTAMEVSITGPDALMPTEWVELQVTVRAVRTDLTLAGLAVAGPEGWTVLTSPVTAALAPGESVSSTLRVKVPAGAAAGVYGVRVTPAVVESSTPATATYSLRVEDAISVIGASYGGGPVSLEPGQSSVVGVQVTNRGGAAALTEVRTVAESSGVFVQPPSVSVSLQPGETQTVSFTVTAPATALPSAPTGIRVEVLGTDGTLSAEVEFEAEVLPVFRPELVVSPTGIDGAPGGTVSVPAVFANHGNAPGFVTVSASTLGLAESSLTVPAQALLVPAFGTASAGVQFTVPDRAKAGDRYSVSVAASDVTGAAIAGGTTLFGQVIPVVSIGASYAPGGPVLPGGTSTGTLTLSNGGNRPVTFALDLAAGETAFAFFAEGAPSASLVVDAWSSLDVALTVRAPRDAAPGSQVLQVTVESDAGAPVVLPVRVEVAAVHVFDLRTLTPVVTVRDPAVESVVVEVALSSGSNTPETVALDFGGLTPDLFVLRADGSLLPVETGELVTVDPLATSTVRALVPVGLAPGVTSRTFQVTADTRSGLSASGTVSIVRPLSDPRVVDIHILAPARAGGVHTVFANISNGGLTTAAGFTAKLVIDGTLVANEPLTPLGPGITRLISFSFVPRADSQVVAVVLASDQPAYDADLGNNGASVTYATPGAGPSSPAPLISSEQAVPAAAASFSLIALIGVALTEVGKSTFISLLFLPLYVKLKPREVLDQYLRGQIHGYIIANPGEHYNAIKEQLGVTNGALAYHLRVLEKAGYIRATRDGMYKRFYPVGVKIPKRRRLSSFQESIVKTVRDKPALSQKDLAELLGVSNQVINYHVKQLEGADIIRLERDGRSSKIFLGPEAPPEEKPAGAASAP